MSYFPKPNKAVILLSTEHHDKSVDLESNKPEIIWSYNTTKGAVDTFEFRQTACTVFLPTKRP